MKTAKQLQKEAEELIKEGKMPSLDDVLSAVADSRDKFGEKIKKAQKGGK